MEEEGSNNRVRLHRVRMLGAAIAPGTSNEIKRRCFKHLDEMTHLKNPETWEDGKGGKCEPLFARLIGWFKLKPGRDERREPNGDYRIVFKTEIDSRDNVSFISVHQLGSRDNVYDNQKPKAKK